MRAYLWVTGAVFGLIVLAHVWRMAVEWPRLSADPWFLALTPVAALLAGWAFRLLRAAAKS